MGQAAKCPVILAGAGATLAEALPSRPAQARIPPLDTTFFQLCKKARLPGRNTLRKYLQKHYGMDPFVDEYRMEEVFNYVYSDAFSENATNQCLGAYWKLISLYRQAIAETTNTLNGNSRFGVGALLRTIIAQLNCSNIDFITFNQDLVIEKSVQFALSKAKYAHLQWSLRHTYELEFDSFLYRTGSAGVFPEMPDTDIRILKLHGSLNWVYRVRSDEDSRNALREPSHPPRCINDSSVPFQLRDSSTKKNMPLVPLIVPPIYEKSSFYRSYLNPVWEHARKAIAQAGTLVVFGYSFPDADFRARSFLKQAFFRNNDLIDVHVIDTEPMAAAKVANLLNASRVHYYRDVPSFRNAGII